MSRTPKIIGVVLYIAYFDDDFVGSRLARMSQATNMLGIELHKT